MEYRRSDLVAHVEFHLKRSLREADSAAARYHIRQALQVVEFCREQSVAAEADPESPVACGGRD